MSDFGAIIDALEVEVRAAWPDLPSDVRGWERGLRLGETLLESELPHVFAHNPTEDVGLEELAAQEEVSFSVQLDAWFRGHSQEDVSVRMDLIRDRLRLNPTLGGLVDLAWMSSRGVVEFPGKPERAGVVIVSARKFA